MPRITEDRPNANAERRAMGLDELYPCPNCGHLHFQEEHLCEECGGDLRDDSAALDMDLNY